LKKSNQQ